MTFHSIDLWHSVIKLNYRIKLLHLLHSCSSRATIVLEIPVGRNGTYPMLLWFNRRFLIFMFISAKCRSSKSNNCECVIFSQIWKSGVNLSCSTSTTWLNDSIFSHVTMMVLANIWWGEQVQGLISRLTAQCSEAPAVNENIVYSKVAIFRTFRTVHFWLFSQFFLMSYDVFNELL